MLSFQPRPGMLLHIASTQYECMPHPLFAQSVFVIEGSESFVYQLRNLARNTLHALKVFKPSYRGEYIARRASELRVHQHEFGLGLCERTCLTGTSAPDLLAEYPDLQYAILMPWIQTKTWAGLMQDKRASSAYRPSNARVLALQTARLLQYLEAHHLAHTDVAGSNIFLIPNLNQVLFLDLECMYYEGALRPPAPGRGTPGYQHPRLSNDGQYCSTGDRFAGAILLIEMLTWCNPVVRALTAENAETLFQSQQLQTIGGPLWQAVRASLAAIDVHILALFDQAWASTQLAACPDFNQWKYHLERLNAAPITR